jgi:hypothetical protein
MPAPAGAYSHILRMVGMETPPLPRGSIQPGKTRLWEASATPCQCLLPPPTGPGDTLEQMFDWSVNLL